MKKFVRAVLRYAWNVIPFSAITGDMLTFRALIQQQISNQECGVTVSVMYIMD
jgi:hypothetical protein